MYIGEFARLAGTTPKAVRLYEQLGLLPEPRRRGKYRVYRAEDLEWVGFIREAQRLGCKLGELVPLLADVTSLDHFPWQKVEQLIAGKLAQIEAEIAKLQRQHQSLTQCAALLALHPCRYGAPVPHDSESQLYQRDAGQAHKVA
ncbi:MULTISPECIES: MerR family transcriptional regulator [Aeromonas]|uniref:MerR family transcriptional regulator n=1 Tax=Aeromonas TaxID=642 RepID=UPI0022E1BC6C|nr:MULTISPECIES: MerR family transcriptional regulator [Aeromonas]WED82133.1 MerR family transcriptional regulator [Aeromonas media]